MNDAKRNLETILNKWNIFVDDIVKKYYYMSYVSHQFFEKIYQMLLDLKNHQNNVSLNESIINLLTYILPHFNENKTENEVNEMFV